MVNTEQPFLFASHDVSSKNVCLPFVFGTAANTIASIVFTKPCRNSCPRYKVSPVERPCLRGLVWCFIVVVVVAPPLSRDKTVRHSRLLRSRPWNPDQSSLEEADDDYCDRPLTTARCAVHQSWNATRTASIDSCDTRDEPTACHRASLWTMVADYSQKHVRDARRRCQMFAWNQID